MLTDITLSNKKLTYIKLSYLWYNLQWPNIFQQGDFLRNSDNDEKLFPCGGYK